MKIQEYGSVEVKKESWVLYNSVQYEENKKDIKTNIETKNIQKRNEINYTNYYKAKKYLITLTELKFYNIRKTLPLKCR